MPSPGAIANRRLLLYLLAAGFILSMFIISLSRHSTTNTNPSFLPSRLSSSSKSHPNPDFKPESDPSSTSSDSSSLSSDTPLAYTQSHSSSSSSSSSDDGFESGSKPYAPIHHVEVDKATLQGDAIMPKLGNETLKAELGRAAWKVFHTTMARFPDKPTEDEKTALFSYVHLFARLYPCGECASHFRLILSQFPPQVSTRSVAAVWACHVHNEVNKSLQKPEFDCSKIGDFYDCGCAEEEGKKEGEKSEKGEKEKKKSEKEKEKEGKEKEKKEKGGKEEKEKGKEGKAHTKQPDLKVEREGEQLGG